MARIRTIKPEFWRDEELSSVTPEAALLAIGLLNHADDDGYFKLIPKLIESDIFPLRDIQYPIAVLLRELSDIGYIQAYDGSDGKEYCKIVSFTEHQVINKKKESKIKGLCSVPYEYGTDTKPVPVGKERKGKEQGKENKSAKAKRFDANDFEMFWKIYPNKKDKQKALAAFKKLNPDEDLLKLMMVELHNQKVWRHKMADKGEWVEDWKYGQGWINGKRWEDEYLSPDADRQPLHDQHAEDLVDLREMQEEGTALFANGKPIVLDGNQFHRTDLDNAPSLNAYAFLKGGNTINSGVTI